MLGLQGVRGAWPAARVAGGVAFEGGQVLLTAWHVVLSPWDADRTRAWLADRPPRRVRDGEDVVEPAEPVAIPVADVAEVMVVRRRALFRPRRLRLGLRSGQYVDLDITTGSTAAFDDFVGELRSLAQAG